MDALRQALETTPVVVTAWLFGSQARGTARPDSDLDLAVLLEAGADPMARFDVQAQLSSALGREVDLVRFDQVPADVAHRILREGVLLVDRDPSRRIAVEVRQRNQYFDMTPIWRATRRLPDGVYP